MSYLDKPHHSPDDRDDNQNDDSFWGSESENYWKWDTIGKSLTAVVKRKTSTIFPTDDKKVPHPTLIVIDDAGIRWTVTVSQKNLKRLMKAAGVDLNTKFKAVYTGDERTPNGVAKVFTLEILEGGRAEAA